MTEEPDIRSVVRTRYGEIAKGTSACGCGPSCCGGSDAEGGRKIGAYIGYGAADLAAIPEGANLGLGCGNPLAHAAVHAGDVVLDLGSGAGMDAFLAAREVGPTGRVIGVDMTAEMVERARENARRVGAENVEFRLGEIERLPVADASVDVIISNCVINLSPDKPAVFAEAFRVLKPGGRMVVSDLVLTRPLPDDVRHSVEAYVGCVAGASLKDDYLWLIGAAGFRDIEVVEERSYGDADVFGGYEWLRESARSVESAKVRAVKPR
jgi:arsenite methyltransferase